ncbi:MAG: DUF1542 domain-containing protein [Paludibacteraceae bacterium]|nr:DUF1542 domain-containing protein [Paludibacteraceae bacterium]
MRKIIFLSLACLMTLCAMAQEINAVRVTHNGTTDWYPFGKNGRIDVTIYEQGNPAVTGGKTYDLSKGNVETAFGTDPLPPIKKAAKNELEARKTEANNRMNQKAMGYEQIEEVQRAKEQGNEKVMLAADAAKIYIDHATNESTIQKEKDNGLNAMEVETQNTLADIQTAIANYKARMKNNIDDIAKDAKDTINARGVYITVEDEAINKIDQAVATAEANIDNATSENDVNNAINTAQDKINQQLAYVQDYYEKLQDAKQAANVDVDKAAANAEAAINKAAEGYGNIETVKHVVVTYQTQLSSVKDKAQLSINAETNLDGVGQLKENTIKQIKNDIQSKAEKEIQDAIQEFSGWQQQAINEVEQTAATAKEKINGLGVDESAKSEAKADIDNIAHTATATINAATSKDAIDNAKTEAIAEIYNVVQNLKDMWISVRENMTVGNYGTLCWKYDLTAIDGAELYTIAGIENGRIVLEEVLANETQAGAGYVIRATAKSLRVKNGDQYTDTPLDAAECNGLQGTFVEIVEYNAGDSGNKLEGNYIVYQNEWRKCGVMVGLRANSAYLIMNYVPGSAPAQAPGRRYISMPLPNSTPTSLGQWNKDKGQKTYKVIESGQFRIVKDNKMYNAQGTLIN